ncbi:MAG: UTRA domain-containing protein [Cohaesibacteraceae bacterium]|nr:UTRA domain-containing protein [Cohaesibacteraceae bacterium]
MTINKSDKPGISPYLQVKQAILQQIRGGELKPGDLISGEEELALHFKCARVTAHRALRELAEEGVVVRKRKSGTRVAAPSARSTRFSIPLIDVEIRSAGHEYSYSLVKKSIIAPPDIVRVKLDLKRDTEALHIQCVHYASSQPYQFEDRWINLAATPNAAKAAFDNEGPNAWLLREVPWSDAEHILYAENAPEDRARLLDLTRGDAVFVLERRTWTADQTVTFVRLFHPGSTFRMRASRVGL